MTPGPAGAPGPRLPRGPWVARGGGLAPVLAVAIAAHGAGAAWAAAPVEESRPAAGVATAPPAAPRSVAPAGDAPPSQLAQLFQLVQRLQQEVNLLRGQVEDQAHRLELLGREQQARYMDLDRRLAGAPAAPATPSTPTGAVGGGEGGAGLQEQPAAAPPASEEGAYQAAYALLGAGQLDAAAAAMEGVIEGFPNGKYTPNAYYWQGEIHRRNGDLERARQALVQVVTLYPEHGKVPDALFKVGVVYAEMDDSDRARSYLERVVREHPSSTAASLAKDYLAELR